MINQNVITSCTTGSIYLYSPGNWCCTQHNYFTDVTDIRKHFCSNTPASLSATEQGWPSRL